MTTDGETRRLVRLGLIGLLLAVIIALMAPVVGGLESSTASYARVRLEPGASVPLSPDRDVVLDSGDGVTLIGGCSIVGPGTWSRQLVAASRTTNFWTGPRGDYEITCKGGAVEVENETGGRPDAGSTDRRAHQLTVAMWVVAGVLGVMSVGVLVASGRPKGPPDTASGSSRTEADADEPEAY